MFLPVITFARENNSEIFKPQKVRIIIAHTHLPKAVTGTHNSSINVQA
jgi:hypothetical protein